MDDNAGSGDDDDIPPEPVSTPKGGTQKPKKEEPALEDRLTDLICRLVDEPSEILKTLSHARYNTWKSFVKMDMIEITGLTYPERRGPVPISTMARSTLIQIKELINDEYRLDKRIALDPEHYTEDMYLEHVFNSNAAKRMNAAQRLDSKTPGSKFGVISKLGVIPTEKAYETWKRARRSKESFPVLKDDSKYRNWKQDFEAEMDAQEISRVVDRDFNPDIMTCSYDVALYEDQKRYLWTVLIKVFTGPLGKTCLQKYRNTRDPRAAYFEHEKLQSNSQASMFQRNRLTRKLQNFIISEHTGTRTEYITNWFEIYGNIVDLSERCMDFETARSYLAEGVSDDTDLSRIFEDEVVSTGNDVADMEFIKC